MIINQGYIKLPKLTITVVGDYRHDFDFFINDFKIIDNNKITINILMDRNFFDQLSNVCIDELFIEVNTKETYTFKNVFVDKISVREDCSLDIDFVMGQVDYYIE